MNAVNLIGISGKIGSDSVEEWRDCYDNNYQVSNLGNVRSKDKEVKSKGNSTALKKGKLLKFDTSTGYAAVKFSNKSKSITKLVHILVAEAFIPNEENKPCVNHIDGNKLNNFISNLEWCTHTENMLHASANNLTKIGEKHYNSKLTDLQIEEIRQKYLTGNYSHSKLAAEYKCSKQNITMILNNKSRKI